MYKNKTCKILLIFKDPNTCEILLKFRKLKTFPCLYHTFKYEYCYSGNSGKNKNINLYIAGIHIHPLKTVISLNFITEFMFSVLLSIT